MVVAVHFRGEFFDTYSELAPESQNILTQIFFLLHKYGAHGVTIFFILSGFLVGGINLERLIGNTSNLKLYVVDRAVRIGFPLLGALILIAIVDAFHPTETHSFLDLLGNLCGLQGVLASDAGGVFWTLAYEIWFYVLIGAVIALFYCKTSKGKLLATATLSLAVCVYSHLDASWLLILCMGIITYYLSKSDIPSYKTFGLIAIVAMLMHPFTTATHVEGRFTIPCVNSTTLKVIFAFCASIFISQIVRHEPKSNMALRFNLIGTKLALFSYSLYITHWQFTRIVNLLGFHKMHYVNAKTILIYYLLIVAALIFAYFFYLLFERNTGFIKTKIKGWLNI